MHPTRFVFAAVVAVALAAAAPCAVPPARAVSCATDWTFTYQGQIKNGGVPMTGTADLIFRLYDAASGGSQVGVTLTQNGVAVNDGVFTTRLDFTNGGAVSGVFTGCARFLDITVNGTPLTPRQEVTTAVPHAAFADQLKLPYAGTTDAGYAVQLTNTANVAQSRTLLVTNTSPDTGAVAIYGEANGVTNLNNTGVLGRSWSGNGFGVIGDNVAPTGNCSGVYGTVASPSGAGVSAINYNATGAGYGVFGMSNSPSGWGGGFRGRGYFTGDLGVGDSLPGARLDVQGGAAGGQAFRVNGDFYVNTNGFVGIGRTTQITSAEEFGVHSSVTAVNGYGGMYMETAGSTARPFYGYATAGLAKAWTYYDGNTASWRLNNNGDQIIVDTTHGTGLGRTPAANKLEVEGNASKTTAGSWLANSDRRIKRDIRTVTGALETLDRVRLVDFHYTPDYLAAHPTLRDRRYHNVLAQEFREVFPDYVQSSGEKLANGEEILQVDTYPLTIYSAAAVQELHAQVKAKDAEIIALQSRLARVEAAVTALATAAAQAATVQPAALVGGR